MVINRGDVLPIGPPQTLYDFPATRFVAEFIGTANLCRADGGDGPWTMSCRFGGVRIRGEAGGVPAEYAWICVRPEDISLSATQPPTLVNAFESRLVRLEFLGDRWECMCELLDGSPVRLRTNRHEGLTLGQSVWVQWPPGACRLVTEAVAQLAP